MFIEKKNEWEVVDTNVKSQNGETLVTIRNLKGVMSNQTMVFFKEELEQI